MPRRSQREIREYVEEKLDPAATFQDDVKEGSLREGNMYAFAADFETGWEDATGSPTGLEPGELVEYFEELIAETRTSGGDEHNTA